MKIICGIYGPDEGEMLLDGRRLHLRSTFDALRDMVMLIDKDGRILKANYAGSAYLGLDFREILGVDAFTESAVTIKVRLKTLPSKQWETAREFRRRIKQAFDAEGVEIPFPQRVVYHRGDAGPRDA